MILKDILSTLEDIAESLRVMANRETDFPLRLKELNNIEIKVSDSNLTKVKEEENELIREKIERQIEERSSGHFFEEDVVDEDLITGGYSV